jgi:hypothetical protein
LFQLFTPAVNLKPKVLDDAKRDAIKPRIIFQNTSIVPVISQTTSINEWEEFLSIEDEYNPAIPNEYEKIIQERREKKREERKRQRSPSPLYGRKSMSGFANRHHSSDEEDNFRPSMGGNRGSAIGPPKSIIENTTIVDTKIANINTYGASNVATKSWPDMDLKVTCLNVSHLIYLFKTF